MCCKMTPHGGIELYDANTRIGCFFALEFVRFYGLLSPALRSTWGFCNESRDMFPIYPTILCDA